jgi:hypothetical protein
VPASVRSCAGVEDRADSGDMPPICSCVRDVQVRMMISGVGWTWRHIGGMEEVPVRHANVCYGSWELLDMDMCRLC